MSDLSMHNQSAYGMRHNYLHHSWAGAHLFWFVVLVLITFMALFFFKPDFVMRKKDCEVTCEVDCMKVLLSAVVIAVVVSFFVWLVTHALC